ncbi:hypothetical protein [Cohnella endophytica]|nr:hypothetical protein [Cohnella endophytica]
MKAILPLPKGITGFTNNQNYLEAHDVRGIYSILYTILRGGK